MTLDQCFPMQPVNWYRVKPGTAHTRDVVPAEIYHRAKSRVAIKVVAPNGETVIKYVTPEQLEKRREE